MKLIAISFAALAVLGAWADTETVDGIEWTYRVVDGKAEIYNGYNAAIPTSTSGAIAIPSTLGDKTVTSIGSCAFRDCSGLTSMTMPNSVTNIGSSAFYGCSGLTSVTIPDSVTSIGFSAFYGCSGLTSVTVPQYVLDRRINNVFSSAYLSITNVSYFSVITNIGQSAFSGCAGLMSVTIPNSITCIGDSAFSGCRGITNVIIPDSVRSVGGSAFSGCSGLTSVMIPDSVTNIGFYAFNDCNSEMRFIISENNEFYKVINGLLLTIDGQTLVSVPANLIVESIPTSVFYIGTWAFRACRLDSNAQPFMEYTAKSFLEPLLNLNGIDGVGQLYQKNLGIGIACLYDYLDSDSKPISLALPTVEAVPMVVGVSSPVGLNVSLGKISSTLATVQNLIGTATDTAGNSVPVTSIVANRTLDLWGITSFGSSVMVPVVLTSPFKRLATTHRVKSYTVRGLMRVWLAPDSMGCRPWDSQNLYPAQSMWQSGVAPKNGVATFLSDAKTLSDFNRDILATQDAVAELTLTFSDLDVQMPIYYKVTEAVDASATRSALPGYTGFIPDPSNFKATYESVGNIKSLPTALRPLTVNGDVDQNWWRVVNMAQYNMSVPYPYGVTEFNPASFLTEYRLYAAVWVQVLDGSQVVDMVPACALDDNEWLDARLPEANAVMRILGDGVPLLNFKSDIAIKYDNIETTLASPPVFSTWKALYAVDPRYNFAPEDWFSSSASNVANKSEWMQHLGLKGTTSPILGRNGRDRDIFMFVSNQEYLQSIGELQFLPILDYMDGSANFLSGDYLPNFHGEPLSNRTGPTSGNFANGGRFWRTYTAYDNGDGTQGINPYNMRLYGIRAEVKSCIARPKVNPCSSGIAKFLDETPFDYYVASTNSNADTYYSFGSNRLARISSDELFDIADAIDERFNSHVAIGGTNWLDAWNSLIWQDNAAGRINDENKLFIDTRIMLQDTLHGVDRKFLYAYWRDAFAFTFTDWIPDFNDGSSAELTNAIDSIDFADVEGVKAAIGGSATEYAAFKAWAGSVKNVGGAAVAGEAAVVANTNAVAAYLLGAERLFDNTPKVKIEDVVVGEDGTEGTKGTMTVAVSVKDGEEVVPCDAEKVAAMFESTSDLGDWNGEAKLTPVVQQLGTVDGAMRFKVTPGDGNSSKAFLRIRR